MEFQSIWSAHKIRHRPKLARRARLEITMRAASHCRPVVEPTTFRLSESLITHSTHLSSSALLGTLWIGPDQIGSVHGNELHIISIHHRHWHHHHHYVFIGILTASSHCWICPLCYMLSSRESLLASYKAAKEIEWTMMIGSSST